MTQNSARSAVVEIDNLHRQMLRFHEGEQIVVTLNARGEGIPQVKFNWDFKSANDIEFSGKNTDTIQFTAPEVDYSRSIRVDVSIESASTVDVIGNSAQSFSIYIDSLDPPNTLGQWKETNLPVVNDLDEDMLREGKVVITLKERVEALFGGDLSDVQRTEHQIAIIEKGSDGVFLRMCGEEVVVLMDSFWADLAQRLNCSAADQSEKYFQSGEGTRIETSCDGKLEQAVELRSYVEYAEEYHVFVQLSSGLIIEDPHDHCIVSKSLKVFSPSSEEWQRPFEHDSLRLAVPFSGEELEMDLETVGILNISYENLPRELETAFKVTSTSYPQLNLSEPDGWSWRRTTQRGETETEVNASFMTSDGVEDRLAISIRTPERVGSAK